MCEKDWHVDQTYVHSRQGQHLSNLRECDQARMEYACAIWSGGNTSKLERLQEKFCRRHRFTLTPFNRRFCYHTLLLFFKIKNNISPSYLTSILPPSFKTTTPYSLRKTVYPVPYLTTQKTLQSFFPRSIILWNSLPAEVQNSSSIYILKRLLKEHLRISN